MSARAAVGIVNRRELRVAGDPELERTRLADAYAEEHLRADAAAAAGYVDELVEPADTRERLAWALESLAGEAGPTAVILAGKRLLITGVITKDSIAFHAAEQAQSEGAEVLLTSFGRVRADDRAGRAAAADAGRRARARRQQPSRTWRRWPLAARALGRRRRRTARDRVRARGRARGQFHDRAGRRAQSRHFRRARSR